MCVYELGIPRGAYAAKHQNKSLFPRQIKPKPATHSIENSQIIARKTKKKKRVHDKIHGHIIYPRPSKSICVGIMRKTQNQTSFSELFAFALHSVCARRLMAISSCSMFIISSSPTCAILSKNSSSSSTDNCSSSASSTAKLSWKEESRA